MATAPTPADRHLALDAIRGIAVLGILLLNIFSFSMPDAGYTNPLAYGGTRAIDIASWATSFVLFEAKFRGLFSLLFGASMTLVIDRARAGGRDGAEVHFRRMLWLLPFGIAHHLFVWEGDILIHYALIGAVAYAFTSCSDRILAACTIGLLGLSVLLHADFVSSGYAARARAQAPAASAADRTYYGQLLTGMDQPGSPRIAAELVIYRADYDNIYKNRSRIPGSVIGVLTIYGPETLGLMLLGILLYRNGFLTGGWTDAQYRRWAIQSYLVGIPPLIALAAWNHASGFDALTVFATALAWAEPFKYAVILGHAALAMLLIRRYADAWPTQRLAAAGRMAFTNYIGTSLVMTSLFYGYGAGLYGFVGRAELYLFVFGMWAAMLAWSKPWLDRYRYGPFEWAWRSLSRGGVQPMRIR